MPVLENGTFRLDESDRVDAKSPTIVSIVETIMEHTGGEGNVKDVIRQLGFLFRDVKPKRCIDPDSFQPFLLAPVRFDIEAIE